MYRFNCSGKAIWEDSSHDINFRWGARGAGKSEALRKWAKAKGLSEKDCDKLYSLYGWEGTPVQIRVDANQPINTSVFEEVDVID